MRLQLQRKKGYLGVAFFIVVSQMVLRLLKQTLTA